MMELGHVIATSDQEELRKRYDFLDQHSKIILGAHVYRATLTELSRIAQGYMEEFSEPYDFEEDPFVFIDELSLNTLFYLDQFMCWSIPMERTKLYRDVNSPEMLDFYQKGIQLLNKVNETKLKAFQIRELDILNILISMKKYLEKQHHELSSREEKLALLEEYFRIYHVSREGKTKTI